MIHAALPNHMRFLMPTLRADAIAARPGAGFVATVLPASSLSATTLAASATKDSADHVCISSFCQLLSGPYEAARARTQRLTIQKRAG